MPRENKVNEKLKAIKTVADENKRFKKI